MVRTNSLKMISIILLWHQEVVLRINNSLKCLQIWMCCANSASKLVSTKLFPQMSNQCQARISSFHFHWANFVENKGYE